jgi:acetylornithine deacetylase/succinyl-diaminopimelate desuccinylase-like protein
MASPYEFIETHRERFEDELKAFLRIKSVSADSTCKPAIEEACQFVARKMRSAGLATEIIPTVGNPLVYGESLLAPGQPTILVYGHYDVQPSDPDDKWESPAFEPTVRGGNIYARGATDDKGQMYLHLNAIEAWMKTVGKLPINVKVIIEGEEEVGSAGIGDALSTLKDRLSCDAVVISDSSMYAPDQPAITYGLKGICYFEIYLDGPKRDLHSGTFGGSVKNPINALTEMLAQLVDPDGRVRVPGFYDDVLPLSEAERTSIARLPFSDEEYKSEMGVDDLFGEKGYSTLERRWARPTCDINGIWGGYQGEGAKTVLPAKAGAKFSFRLVPNQEPSKIESALKAYLEEIKPKGISIAIKHHHGAAAVVVPLESPTVRAASRALQEAYGKKPFYIREGGSIPICSSFKEVLGVDSLLLGFGLNDDNTHSPNEKFCLKDYHRGALAIAYLFEELANKGDG